MAVLQPTKVLNTKENYTKENESVISFSIETEQLEENAISF